MRRFFCKLHRLFITDCICRFTQFSYGCGLIFISLCPAVHTKQRFLQGRPRQLKLFPASSCLPPAGGMGLVSVVFDLLNPLSVTPENSLSYYLFACYILTGVDSFFHRFMRYVI